MRFLLMIVLVVALNMILQPFLPWWIIAVTGFAVGTLFGQKTYNAFLAAFIGVFLLWIGYALYLDFGNNFILSSKVAEILGALTGGSRIGLLLLTGAVGGMVSGLSAFSGTLVKKAID